MKLVISIPNTKETMMASQGESFDCLSMKDAVANWV